MKKTLILVTAFVLQQSLLIAAENAPAAAGPQVVKLTADTPVSFDSTRDGRKMPLTGLFERDVVPAGNVHPENYVGTKEDRAKMSSVTRTVKLYIPATAEAGAYLAVLTVPDGKDTVEWMAASGWTAIAERYSFCLYVLEPVNKKWGTYEEESAYISQAYTNIAGERGKFYLTMPTYYLVGYGNGGKALQMYAMKNGITVAAAAFVESSDIDKSFLDAMSATKYDKTDIAFSQVPVPVLIASSKVSGNTANVVNYWQKANAAVPAADGFNGGKIYYQQKGTLPQFTPDACSAVAVFEKAIPDEDPAFDELIYTKFLSRYSRYGGFAGGNTLMYRPDHKALGVRLGTITVGGSLREYLVYVPKAVKDSGKSAPILYYFPGSQQTDTMMFDISNFYKRADQGNFILVICEAITDVGSRGWPVFNSQLDPTNYDLAYVKALLEQTAKDYRIDLERRYISGQSAGCMFSQTVAIMMPEYFAAAASTSGPLRGASSDEVNSIRDAEPIPFYLLVGQYDIFPSDFTQKTDTQSTLLYWLSRNRAGGLDKHTSKQEGRYTTYEWKNDKDVPMLRYTVTANRGHSIIPQEMAKMWNEWLSKWHIDANGKRIYTGGAD